MQILATVLVLAVGGCDGGESPPAPRETLGEARALDEARTMLGERQDPPGSDGSAEPRENPAPPAPRPAR